MFSHSDKFEKLPAALVALQASLPSPRRTAKNEHFSKNKNSYVDLDTLWLAVRPVLTEHRFALFNTFAHDPAEGRLLMTTTLMHESGEWISSVLPMPVSKANDPQAVGSAITYGRRYSLASILGVVSDEDDDGNAAAKSNGHRQTVPLAAKKETMAAIGRKLKDVYGDAYKKAAADHFHTLDTTYDKITQDQAEDWLLDLTQKAKRQGTGDPNEGSEAFLPGVNAGDLGGYPND